MCWVRGLGYKHPPNSGSASQGQASECADPGHKETPSANLLDQCCFTTPSQLRDRDNCSDSDLKETVNKQAHTIPLGRQCTQPARFIRLRARQTPIQAWKIGPMDESSTDPRGKGRGLQKDPAQRWKNKLQKVFKPVENPDFDYYHSTNSESDMEEGNQSSHNTLTSSSMTSATAMEEGN